MIGKELCFLFVYFCNVWGQILSSSNYSVQDNGEVTVIHGDVKQIIRPFGSRIISRSNFGSIEDQTDSIHLTMNFTYDGEQLQRNITSETKGIIKQKFTNYPQIDKFYKERNNDDKDSILLLANRQANSENRTLKNLMPPKSICRSSDNATGQRCLRKIRRKILNVPLINITWNENSKYRLRAKENILSSNIPNNSYLGNTPEINNRLNYHQIADNLKPYSVVSNGNVPTKRESKPCTCYWGPDICGCDCKGSLNYDDFQDVSKEFFPCRNFTFAMTDGQHYALPPNFFSGIKRVDVFSLIIINSTFEYICDQTPTTSPFKNVKFAIAATIKLINVRVRRGWNWKPFEQLRSSSGGRLNIIIEDSKLRRLTSDFSNLAGGSVGTVNIAKSNLQMVGSHAFGTFENITYFHVPNNKIESLRRTDFPQMLLRLEEINLRNNELRHLDDNLFTNMPFLKEIMLSGNPLIVLSEKTFHDVISHVNLVGISDIPLICDCRLKWLKDSSLSNNAVTKKNMNGVICKRPSYLRGIPLDFLSKEHLICF